MWFFIPKCLVELEYINGSSGNKENKYKEYDSIRLFAFFVVNFGYTREQFDALTQAEALFIMKAYEEKVVADSTIMDSAVTNAIGNTMRHKGKKAIPLWKKKPKAIDKEEVLESYRIAKAVDAKSDGSWLEKVYKANNLKLKKRKEDGKK